MKQNTLIVIVGPTAVGKTAAAIQVALRLNTEIVSADSRQIFRELQIGTAKPTPAELALVPHHFVSIKSIHEEYDAGRFEREGLEVISRLFEKHDVVVLCGGSGLYVKAICEGFDPMPEVPEGVRADIVEAYQNKGLAWLQEQVAANDPEYFAMVDRQNPQRLMRALELYYAGSKSLTSLRNQERRQRPFTIRKFGLELDRPSLYSRIDRRMDDMIVAGLFEEAKQFYPQRHLQALQTVGYQEIFGYMGGEYSREEAVRLLKRNSRRYAKRQMTWFKKDKDISWLNPGHPELILP